MLKLSQKRTKRVAFSAAAQSKSPPSAAWLATKPTVAPFKRAKAVSNVARNIIDNANVSLEGAKYVDEKDIKKDKTLHSI